MSDRRSENPEQIDFELLDRALAGRRADNLVAAVRRGVESGTIKGAEFEADPRYGVWIKHDGKLKTFSEHFDPGAYLVVGPI